METTPTPETPAFVTARITLGGPRHAVRNVPEHFSDTLTRYKRTLLWAACGAGVYSGLWIDQTETGETVPWVLRPPTRDCPACVRRVKALYRDGLVR